MRPAILLVIGDDGGAAAMLAELGRYAGDYQVERAGSGVDAIERLRTWKADGVPVALVLADLALAKSDGELLLGEVRREVPTAKRAILVDWGPQPDRMVALRRAVALGLLDAILTKPSGPRDEEFHGVITEELSDWSWSATPPVEAVRVVGDPGGRAGAIKELLERLSAPTGIHAPDSEVGRSILAKAGPGAALPVVEVLGAAVLADPTNRQIAASFGAAVDTGGRTFDLAVVGAGPAGLGAAVYGSSEGLETVILEVESYGGQAGTSSMIRNYLGFPRGITGRQLGRRAILQATRFGTALDMGRGVVGLEPAGSPGEPHRLRFDDGEVAHACAVVLACGVTYRRLGVPALEERVGTGVFYGAAGGHARALAGSDVVVVGAGNSGGQAAIHLARHGARVTIACRRDSLAETMSDYLVQEIETEVRIEVLTGTEVVDGGGAGALEWLELADRRSGERTRRAAAALFVLIGTETRTAWLPASIQRDDAGYVRTGTDVDQRVAGWRLDRPPEPLETSVPGVFAAGDVRAGSVKRVATAVGEGATAIPMVHRWLAAQPRPGTATPVS